MPRPTRAAPAAAKRPAAGRRTPARPSASPARAVPPAQPVPAPALEAAAPPPTVPATAAPKRKKPKLVRDGFTMPEADYALLGALKKRALHAGHEVKKSELVRAGLRALAAMPDAAYIGALEGVERIKPGRPAKD